MRKPIALLLLGFVAITSDAGNTPGVQPSATGLPKDVVPRSYLIHLEPNIETQVTDGIESIEIEILKPTNWIVLNALDTQIAEARIEIGDQTERLTPELDSKQQRVSFDLKNVLQPGKYTLSIRFQSRIVEQPHGLFLQPYKDGELAAAEHLLATELQTGDTRRVFPCWDESTFRATFQLSVKTGKENTVISNMPVFVEQPVGPDQKIVVFEKTPLIASDTVLLVCGKLEWLDDEVAGVKLRIVTTPGKKELGKYAMEVTKQLLPYFSDYFAIPFPLSKLDQIALPCDDDPKDLGGIVYDEDALLFDPEANYESAKQRIFLAIADKIAHQWWGKLVTMTSRNDLWLNEGFESWLAKKAADHCHPQWKIWLHATSKKEATMAFDAGEMTHAIQASSADEEQTISASDVIMNQKPWLLLRMLENFSGEDPFRDGVRAYLATHQGSETTGEDLWTSIERVTGKPI
jgi:aminopeptidase N